MFSPGLEKRRSQPANVRTPPRVMDSLRGAPGPLLAARQPLDRKFCSVEQRRQLGPRPGRAHGGPVALPSCLGAPLAPLWSPPRRSCLSAERSRQSFPGLNCSPRNKRPLGRGRVGAGSRISLIAQRQPPTPAPRASAPASPPSAGFQVSIRYTGTVSVIPAFSPQCTPRPPL